MVLCQLLMPRLQRLTQRLDLFWRAQLWPDVLRAPPALGLHHMILYCMIDSRCNNDNRDQFA